VKDMSCILTLDSSNQWCTAIPTFNRRIYVFTYDVRIRSSTRSSVLVLPLRCYSKFLR